MHVSLRNKKSFGKLTKVWLPLLFFNLDCVYVSTIAGGHILVYTHTHI